MSDHPEASKDDVCEPASGCCGPSDLSRRGFLAFTGAGLAAHLFSHTQAIGAVAGPFRLQDVEAFPVPADKKFAAEWLASLVARGVPTVYRKSAGELEWIGMPVGGIGSGQVYLGGDGRLWRWDIFNQPAADEWRSSAGPHYAKPAKPSAPIADMQGFNVEWTSEVGTGSRSIGLAKNDFAEIEFEGAYPIGRLRFRDRAAPIAIDAEVFSPFIPLNEDDSSLPCILYTLDVTNTSSAPIVLAVDARLADGSLWAEREIHEGERFVRGRSLGKKHAAAVMGPAVAEPASGAKPDILFEDFEKSTYEGWTVTGSAFGEGPIEVAKMPGYQGFINGQGARVANTHQTRNGENVQEADRHIGTLTSRSFVVERRYIRFRIGGGKHAGQTCINLLVDGAPVRTMTGKDEDRMHLERFDVSEYAGREARLQVVDGFRGGWGQIGVDEIVFTDSSALEPANEAPGYGTMALAFLAASEATDSPFLVERGDAAKIETLVQASLTDFDVRTSLQNPQAVRSRASTRLGPGEKRRFTFAIAWHFVNPWRASLDYLQGSDKLRLHYAARFADAGAVLEYVDANLGRLVDTTRLWSATLYDSTLPYWFLDRTFANLSTLATATCWRFDNGRFYGWEGTYCCAGTCSHVWQYAQGVARVFPKLERYLREEIDYGQSFHDDSGAIDYRGEASRHVAHDGQAGTIVRAWREHTMSPDGAFLRRRWPRIKKSIEYLIAADKDDDGLLEGAQYNTLDATWWGPMAWISSHYLAAVLAGSAMAEEMGDEAFAAVCRRIVERGKRSLVEKLYNGEYFVHRKDPAHPEANGTGDGCHIDQVFGQSFLWQSGLGRVVPEKECRSALRSLYRYSVAPDVGPYRKKFEQLIKGGRWYAMPGEGGLLMCTWPKGGHEAATGRGNEAWAAGYFNECMSGFEHQVASHMIFEGLVQEGLAVTRLIHDRYHAKLRNPWNEVECSDHYARALASYGSFVATSGFEHHGPKAHIGFVPRLMDGERFRAAFIAAEGWGTIACEKKGNGVGLRLTIGHGRLRLRTLAVGVPGLGASPSTVELRIGDQSVTAAVASRTDGAWILTLARDVVLETGQELTF